MLKWMAAIIFGTLAAGAWADSYFVEEPKGVGTSDADRNSVAELVRIGVSQNGHTVSAKKEDATFTLAPNLMKLGDAYVLSLQKKNKAGSVVFADKMKATEMSDMDTVASRLTRAVIEQKSLEETADVTNITRDEETLNSRRYNATRQWILGIGPGWTTNLRSGGGGFTFALGFLWGLDPDFSLNLSWMINNGRDSDDSSFSDFSIGGEYYFKRSKFSPFLGVRMGYDVAKTSDSCDSSATSCKEDKASGWGGTLTGGYKLFRTSTVNAAIMGNYTYIFDETTAGNPSLFSILFAVYY